MADALVLLAGRLDGGRDVEALGLGGSVAERGVASGVAAEEVVVGEGVGDGAVAGDGAELGEVEVVVTRTPLWS